MHKVKYTSLLLSSALLGMGVLIGWLILSKLIEHRASLQFIRFAFYCSGLIFLIKLLIYKKAKELLLFQIIFIGVLGVDLAWFFTCFFLPLIWLPSVDIVCKIFVLAVYAMICVGNVRLAIRIFNDKWKSLAFSNSGEKFSFSGHPEEWISSVKSMKISATIFLPGIPVRYSNLISIAFLIFLIIGFVLRGISPTFSMLFLVFPFSICAGCCLQMSAYHFSEAVRLAMFEKKNNVSFKSS